MRLTVPAFPIFFGKQTGKGLVLPKTAGKLGFSELEKRELEKRDVADTYCSYINKYSATNHKNTISL